MSWCLKAWPLCISTSIKHLWALCPGHLWGLSTTWTILWWLSGTGPFLRQSWGTAGFESRIKSTGCVQDPDASSCQEDHPPWRAQNCQSLSHSPLIWLVPLFSMWNPLSWVLPCSHHGSQDAHPQHTHSLCQYILFILFFTSHSATGVWWDLTMSCFPWGGGAAEQGALSQHWP